MVIDIINKDKVPPRTFELHVHFPHARLESICDVHLEAQQDERHPVKCFLACKMIGHKKIKIIDTYGHNNHKENKDDKIINFFNDKAKNFNVKIMHKNGNILAILANG